MILKLRSFTHSFTEHLFYQTLPLADVGRCGALKARTLGSCPPTSVIGTKTLTWSKSQSPICPQSPAVQVQFSPSASFLDALCYFLRRASPLLRRLCVVPRGLALCLLPRRCHIWVASILGSGWGRRKRPYPYSPRQTPVPPTPTL